MSDEAPTSSDLLPRDRHLFAPGPKRILAIDGGGVRGVVALAFLERIERILESQYGRPVRLCDHFDLIGGTSTGAIIATALALGYKAAEIRDFYFRLGPRVFRRPKLRLPGWQAKFDARALARELEEIIGSRKLDSTDLQTGLGVMLKRIDTGSAWTLMNNSALHLLGHASGSLLHRQSPLFASERRARQHRCAALFRSAGDRDRAGRSRPVRRRRPHAA